MLIKIQFFIKKNKKPPKKSVVYLYFKCFYLYFNLNVIKGIFDLLFRLSTIAFDVCYYFAIILSIYDNIDNE